MVSQILALKTLVGTFFHQDPFLSGTFFVRNLFSSANFFVRNHLSSGTFYHQEPFFVPSGAFFHRNFILPGMWYYCAVTGESKKIVFTSGATEKITSGVATSDFWSPHK
jgi:hypothetical protein